MHLIRTPRRKPQTLCILFAAIAAMAAFASTSRASVPIYGGPTYDATTDTGYYNQTVPTQSAGNATAIGSAYKDVSGTPLGTAAFRWNTTSFTELDPLSTDSFGHEFTAASAINSTGTAVGNSEKFSGPNDLGPRAVRWNPFTTTPTELGNLGTDNSGVTSTFANAINNTGTIAGYCEKYAPDGSDLGERAVCWDPVTTTATELGTLGLNANNQTNASALAINDLGTTVGYSEKYDPLGTDLGSRAVRWNFMTTTATELGNLGTDNDGVTNGQADSVNSAGAAVGYMNKYTSGSLVGARAVRWDAGTSAATELGNLGTDLSGNTTSQAYAINSIGTSVGFAARYSGDDFQGFHAVRWDANTTTATELGNLGTDPSGNTTSEAVAINDSNISVGFSEKYANDGTDLGPVAVAWLPDTTPIDLNSLLSPTDALDWTLTEADSISNTGWITGVGTYDPDGPGPDAAYQRDFLIQLPEPTSMMLLIPTLFALTSRRRTLRAADSL